MSKYALLMLPSANRVYADSAVGLTRAELEVFDRRVLGGRIGSIAEERIGGVPYVTFEADALTHDDVALVSNLSSAYALFGVEDGLLRPVGLTRLDRFDDDLITIPKYVGKTNEQFTKLLLNVTVLSSDSAPELLTRRLRVLDPMCGRGTTLNQALMYGYHASGLDLDRKDFDAYAGFIGRYLRDKRVKHQAETAPIRREGKLVGHRLDVSLGLDKDSYKAGDTIDLTMIHADTTRAAEFFKPERFDVIVTDAPYGVQHGSRTERGLRRGPLDLLKQAVPGWTGLLRRGGAIGIAWNVRVAARADTAKVLASAGLDVLDDGPYAGFEHRVDQAIQRDIVIARKP